MSNQGNRAKIRRGASPRKINSVLGNSSVICVTFFAAIWLFSCQPGRLGNGTDTVTAEKIAPPANASRTLASETAGFAIRVLQNEIRAFQGLPLAIPLEITLKNSILSSPGTTPQTFPTRIEITTSDGERLVGDVRWLSVTATRSKAEHHQTSENTTGAESAAPANRQQQPNFPWAERLRAVVEIAPPPLGVSSTRYQAYLIIDDGSKLATGLARIGAETVSVQVLELPPNEIIDPVNWAAKRGPGGATADERWAQPDRQSALETFRRVLLSIPDLSVSKVRAAKTDLLKILGDQSSARFQFGLAQLRRISPSVADTLVELLTRTCRDGRLKIASWPSDPSDLSELDYLLTSIPKSAQEMAWATAVLAWCENRPRILAWVESADGAEVRLAVANLTRVAQDVELVWESDPAGLDGRRLRVPGALVVRTALPRRSGQATGLAGGHGGIILRQEQRAERGERGERGEWGERGERGEWAERGEWGGRVLQRLWVPAAENTVVPPHAVLGPTTEMWQVDSWCRGTPQRTPPSAQTHGLLRHFAGRWQLVLECRVAQTAQTVTVPIKKDNTDLIPSWARREKNESAEPFEIAGLAGVEALTFFIGPYVQPTAVFSILVNGEVIFWEQRNPAITAAELDLQIQFTNASWTLTLNLPPEWLSAAGTMLELGFLRTHHNSLKGSGFPHPAVPWRINPGRRRYNLAAWSPTGFSP